MPIIGLSAKDLNGACTKLWDILTSGKTDEEARKAMKLGHEDYTLLKRKVFERQIEGLTERTAEETFVQYTIDQIANIRSLTEMIAEFKQSKQYNAMVGAVKARADLNDKLLKMGQDLGVIEKQPSRHEVVGGIVVTDMSSKQLKTMIVKELVGLNDMMKNHGGADIIDMPVGPTHVPAKKVKALEVGGKRMRVFKGRKPAREKIKVKAVAK